MTIPDNSTNDAADGWLPTAGDILQFYPGAYREPFLPELRRALADGATAAAPVQPARPKRQRKPSHKTLIDRAKSAGASSVTIEGVIYTFGQATDQQSSNPWDEVLPNAPD